MPPEFVYVDLNGGEDYGCVNDDDDDMDVLSEYDWPDAEVSNIGEDKNVRFDLDANKTVLVECVRDMDEHEIAGTWYSRLELKAMTLSSRYTAHRRYMAGTLHAVDVEGSSQKTSEAGHCSLEGLIRKDYMRSRVRAVLRSQDLERASSRDGDDRDNVLQQISKEFSVPCVEEALVMAKEDALFAKLYLISTREELDAYKEEKYADAEDEEIPRLPCFSLGGLWGNIKQLAWSNGQESPTCTTDGLSVDDSLDADDQAY